MSLVRSTGQAINIIESGSNSNGDWVKLEGGTLIQSGVGTCPADVGYAEVTFPLEFKNINYIMIANHKYTGGNGYGGSGQLRNITNPQSYTKSSAYIYSYFSDGSIANYVRNVQYIAIGKWK